MKIKISVILALLLTSTALADTAYNVIDLGMLSGFQDGAFSINNNGQIVGTGRNEATDSSNAMLFDATGGGNNINLGGSYSSASSINIKGQIVGWAEDTATLFDATGGGNNRNLGTLAGGILSSAYSINNNGQIVGTTWEGTGNSKATFFDATDGGNNRNLGGLGIYASRAYSINNNGQIVGWASDATGITKATLFDATGGGANIDLNTLIDPALDWYLEYAYSINDKGWIVGSGSNPDGQYVAFLLTPVPEPATLLLLGLGGLFLRRSCS